MRVGLKALAVAAPILLVAGCGPENEDRLQEYLDKKYGYAEYNVLGCDDDVFKDEKITKCGVVKGGGDVADEWTVTVEFDGDEVRRVEGMERRSE